MRLASVRTPAGLRVGTVDGDQVVVHRDLAATSDDVIRGLVTPAQLTGGERVALDEVELASPVGRFNRDVLCTGWNYADHFYETQGAAEMPAHPNFFTRGPDSVIGPRDDIAWDPGLSQRYDYEAELALVIGTDGRSIAEDQAWKHVFGVLVANDVSLRDLQFRHGGQWLKGKSADRTCPLGPWITTLDEVDPSDLAISCRVNGELLQSASTAQMAFAVPRLLAELSRGMTLRAGDVVLTGTPSGIGNARDPQVRLAEGDVVETEIEGLGRLVNRVVRSVL
ncbi:fumarylacetoacetate hydrolase family protein [Kineosporia succinea]|uniref:2-keto-4-pentenoate hydratase/2-oxohepta-3-ene-1,7-dioic acid hydratase in catechol pathway n=1 Tax=Kineosporia succinea TaxID=84632 RepID=A0ABT9PBE8_9ACTN|nr:fumarylacetoacetate hydrolase family protein [Kineosporia succinea]MDP9829802.1 2-keto-4-pentenoate hydratase/2-oxohepta-3-ene-1,7-dioic acid hydratase in catechol pathway [Kineosporia succinea]